MRHVFQAKVTKVKVLFTFLTTLSIVAFYLYSVVIIGVYFVLRLNIRFCFILIHIKQTLFYYVIKTFRMEI